MVAFSGFKEKHELPPSGNVHSIVPAHRHGQKNGQQSWCIFIVVLFAFALAAARAIRSELSPNGDGQWFPVKPWTCYIRKCWLYCIVTPPWLSKWL
jgi:hypothetical protein